MKLVMYRCFLKRFLDFSITFVGLIVISPIFVLVMLFLAIANRGKVFFLQERPGKGGKVFCMIKFKTMNDKRGVDGKLLSDAERLTKVGVFVRSTSLDEIPQLLCVLWGTMSLIGPRPLLVQYLSLYDKEQRRRHEVRPGITGWAQVNGRNTISWQQKFKYDVWYVDHVSFKLDVKILFLTVKKVLVREGITSRASETMEVFTGNN